MIVLALVGTEDGSSAASARTLLLKVLRMAPAPRWLKINDGSSTMMAQEPYTVAQNNDGSMFSKLKAISKHSASKVKQTASSRSMGLPSSIRATANPWQSPGLIQSMDLAEDDYGARNANQGQGADCVH